MVNTMAGKIQLGGKGNELKKTRFLCRLICAKEKLPGKKDSGKKKRRVGAGRKRIKNIVNRKSLGKEKWVIVAKGKN